MFPLLIPALLFPQAAPKAVPVLRPSMYVALTSEGDDSPEAEREAREIVAGKAKAEDAKLWIARLKGWYFVFVRRNLVEDIAYLQAQRILAALKADQPLPSRTLGSMTESERRDLAEFLGGTPMGRTGDRLNALLRDPSTAVGFSMEMTVTVESGFQPAETTGAFSLLPPGKVLPPNSPEKGFKGFEVSPAVEGVALRFPSGLTNRFRAQFGTDALNLLDELRKERLDRLRAELEKEGWRRVAQRLANPKSWDGKRPITFGELDPVFQKALRESSEREFLPGDRISGAGFDLAILIQNGPASWSGTNVIPRI